MDILEAAAEAVKDRHGKHGDYRVLHRRIARLWSAYLDVEITETDVARMEVLKKVARSKEGDETYQDHATDIAGYADLLDKLTKKDSPKTDVVSCLERINSKLTGAKSKSGG